MTLDSIESSVEWVSHTSLPQHKPLPNSTYYNSRIRKAKYVSVLGLLVYPASSNANT